MGPEGGSVINIGSGVSSMRPPNSAVYTATKAAVDAITGVLAKELGPRRIRVNSTNPGMSETEGVHAAGFVGSDFQTMVETQAPLGRVGSRTISRRRPSTWTPSRRLHARRSETG
jgi:3-oxoacyl-[acyl-carrier protein] reductase